MPKTLSKKLEKVIIKLQKKKYRRLYQKFLIEGRKCLEEAISSGYPIDYVFLEEDHTDDYRDLIERIDPEKIFLCDAKVMNKISTLDTPEGIIAIAPIQMRKIDKALPALALSQIMQPGNFGTILRTAEWFGIRNIVYSSGTVDPYNPKTVRGSMGSLFRLNIQAVDNMFDFLREQKKRTDIYTLTLADDAVAIYHFEPSTHWILVLGSESAGIAAEIDALATRKITIPKYSPIIDSLNVAVATGIALFYFTGKITGKL